MCCCEADWKREVVPDHKFDFVNVKEFHKTDIWTRIKYIFRYIFLLKSIAVYGLDIFTATTFILSDHWTNSISQRCGDNCAVNVQFKIAKWVFVGCIIFSFLLLGYETWKAKQVVDSRDISYAFTNLIANDYYSFRSYDNFCLFCHIEGSTKKKDDFAFFIFFTFKGWKRLLLADGPRQSINALVLYSFAYANGFQTSDIPAYWDNSAVTAMLLFSMIATVLIFAGSLLLLIVAAVFYVPLLCYIRGNLKEYVCHKVDKRISELIKKKQRQRIARNAALEKKIAQGGAVGGIKNSKGAMMDGAMPQPTLPQISLEEEEYQTSMLSEKSRRKVDNTNQAQIRGYEYPPNGPGSVPLQSPEYGIYSGINGDYGSSTDLISNAAPLGISYPPPVQHMNSGSSISTNLSTNTSNQHRPYSPSSNFPSSRSISDLTQQQQQAFLPPSRSHSDFNQPSFPPSRSYSDLRYNQNQQQQSGRMSPYTPSQDRGYRDSYGSGHGLPYDDSYRTGNMISPPPPPSVNHNNTQYMGGSAGAGAGYNHGW
ncbi:uncharacterized protein IL334_001456 [Kwoniella shivajii]|uniref:Vacuolar protein n=1 Tax=Kwoniella shivajii TaxID=564305 RepID=A0ABZ1CRY2_9TREE|nr:hypothetical protein IL334_001456 [Kwoniella shivajii]